MKRIYISLILALAVISCQESTVESVSPILDDIMRFNFVGPSAQTKVSADAFEVEDQIGLYVTDYVDETTPMPLQISGNRANNIFVTYNGTAWIPEQEVYWGKGKSDVYAYYPYIETVTDVNKQYFEIATDQTGEGYEASDFLWAKAEGVSRADGEKVNLEMKHLMSKLIVRIVAGEDYVGSLPEDAVVQLHNTVTNVNIDMEKAAVSKDPYSGMKSITMRNLGVKISGAEKAVVYEAIVVPQMIERSVPLIEINSKSVSYLLEDDFNFRPGVVYTYTVTLNTSTTAIKVEIGCEIEDWNNPEGSGNEGDDGNGGNEGGEGNEDGEGNEGGEGEDTNICTDLSAKGSANCYLIQHVGDYKFKAVIGNTDATVGNVKSVEVLWESFGTDVQPNVGDLINSVSYENGYIRFSTPENFSDGNAVIAAKNSKGTILWSWHIWCAEEGWQEQVYYNDAGTMMDRNLGATSATPGEVGALGLMYQWGRKDPLMGPSTLTSATPAKSTGTWSTVSGGTMSTEALDPMKFYTSLILLSDSWHSTKTLNDPCPRGWRVPDGGSEGVWAKASAGYGSTTVTDDTKNKGVNYSKIFGDAETIWYPYAGSYSNYGSLSNVSGGGLCWSCSVGTSGMYNFKFSRSEFLTEYILNSSFGFSVRCIKDTVQYK